MAVTISYPKEVWQYLRQLWEAAPKMTFPECREQVSAMLGCDCPSPQAISARAKRDKWKKIPLRKRNKNPVEPVLMAGVDDQQAANSEDACAAEVEAIVVNSEIAENQPKKVLREYIDPTPVLNEAKRILSTVEKIVWGHRRRSAIAGRMIESVMVAMDNLAEECIRPSPNDEDFEEKITRREKMLKALYNEMRLLELMSVTMQIQQKVERENWGIELSGDDGESDKRKANIALLESKTKSARTGLAQQKSELADRLRMIESGEIFQREEDRGNDDEQD